ncbi:hypothetical protein GJ744_008058 [Endocarpon pusillum]|uniref:Nucleoside phosphorylase domain-containing protein n=1 Tax=Endocarpon pusillum TaxID=364733 RepID=A0A8H7E5K8_9EURO|nr:hypothetical protein GJ744_008058 [Endocarpon pusillum]
MAERKRLRREDYTVGWVCALYIELAAAEEMLDEEHNACDHDVNDTNIYTLGRIGEHNVVIACLPEGQTGTNSAAAVAVQMKSTFKSIRFGLMVGIGGGVPSVEPDIRLGDVVVSTPHMVHAGVVQYDFGKATPTGFDRTGFLNAPPAILLNSVTKLRARYSTGKSKLPEYISKLNSLPTFARENAGPDKLYEADYNHEGGATCEQCSRACVVERQQRNQEILVHYGTIASGNQVMRNAAERDKVSSQLGGVLCFEMEAAGLMNSFPCLVIRGICDYADSHKNKRWQAYAAGAAAAYAKEVLSVIPTAEVARSCTVDEIIREKSALEGTLNRLPYAVEELQIAQEENRARQRLSTRDDKAKRFLKMLYTCHYRDHKERNRDRVPGTCEWFTNHSLFQNWKKNKKSSLLWASADPGCGKSVLAKYLVDHIFPNTSQRTTCYFFFKDDLTEQKSITNAVCAILRQIFLAKPHLLQDAILDRLETDGDKFIQSFHDLWSTLISVAADQNAGELVCILDALDECQDSDRSQLIQAVRNLYIADSNEFSLKILLTSRPYDHIRREFRELERHLPTIHLSGEDEIEIEKISREIDLVIQRRVEDICTKRCLEPDERIFLQDQLTLVPNRTYLWVDLTLDVIENISGFTKGNVRKAVRQIPQTVDDAYNKILDRSSDTEKARRLLHIVVAATRPLSLDEMSVIMAIEETHRSYDDIMQEIEPEERFRGTLRDLCGLFVTIVDAKIYLLHQTSREFLIRDYSLASLKNSSRFNSQYNSLGWKHSLQLEESNRILAERCIWYLTSDIVETRLRVFHNYSARNWAAHFYEAGIRSEEKIAALARILCETGSRQYKTWSAIYVPDHHLLPESGSCLTIASYLGLDAIVKPLLETGKVDVDSKDSDWGRTPLSYAAENGHERVVKLLLDTGKVDVDSKDSDLGRTPLSWAAENGHKIIMKLLLDTGKIDVDSKDSDWDRTPLSYAAENGHERVVKLLLDTGKVDVDSKDSDWGRTSLSWAAENGHERVVKLLLDTGKVDVDTKDSDLGRTPLSWAAKNGHKRVIKLLLDTGKVDVDSAVRWDQTLLSYAAEYGDETIVKLLLDTGKVDIDSKDSNWGRTPLSWAAENGHERVVKLLLDTGKVDVDSKDSDWGRTPLSWAANNGHERVVKLLLETGKVDVNSKDDEDQTPLSYAAENGYKTVVKLLLSTRKVDVDSRDSLGRTPLSWAARNRHERVIKLLKKAQQSHP